MIVKARCAICGCDVDYDVPTHELHDAREHAASSTRNFCADCEMPFLPDRLAFFRVEQGQ